MLPTSTSPASDFRRSAGQAHAKQYHRCWFGDSWGSGDHDIVKANVSGLGGSASQGDSHCEVRVVIKYWTRTATVQATKEICLNKGKAKPRERRSIETLPDNVVVESGIRPLPAPRYVHVFESRSVYVQFQYHPVVLKIWSRLNSKSQAGRIAHGCIKSRAAKKHEVRGIGGCRQR